jgi:hypothetical protein
MPEGKDKARGWWVPSKRVPVRILDVMVIAAGVAAAVLLVLTIIGFSMASKRGELLETARQALAKADSDIAALKEGGRSSSTASRTALKTARAEITALRARPTQETLDAANAETASWQKKANDTSSSLGECERKLGDANAEIADLQRRTDALKKGMSTSDRSKRDLYDKVQELSGMLRNETVKVNEAKQRLRSTSDRLDVAEAKGRKLEAGLAKANAGLAQRQTRIDNLENEFGDIPIIPLTEDLAKIKWEEIQKDVASRKGREDRIDLLFRAKLVLAGTPLESYANRSWVRERQERQASLEREAAVVYNNVMGKIRTTPDAHVENLRLLNEALRKVMDSRYEDRVLRLIEKEKAYVGAE